MCDLGDDGYAYGIQRRRVSFNEKVDLLRLPFQAAEHVDFPVRVKASAITFDNAGAREGKRVIGALGNALC